MKKKALWVLIPVLALVLGLAAGTWAAGPDSVTFTSISTTPSSTHSGQNYEVTGTVNAGDPISLSFTVGASKDGTSTRYAHTLYLSAPTNAKPLGASDVSVTGLIDAVLASSSSTVNESATLTAPATPGAYQVRILADDRIKGTGQMNSADFFFVNFVVAASSACEPAATSLVLSQPACVLLHDTKVSLAATLKDSDTNTALGGKTIDFYVAGQDVGAAVTGDDGVATLTYNPSLLKVGDHALSAAWQSDDKCLQNPTVTGAKLGVQYLFLGFQPPINADGSTILTGKAGPVKIKIVDANGVPVSDATALVFFADGTPTIVGTDAENVTSGLNFDSGNVMRYSDSQYVYNWDLSTTTNGTKTIRVFLGEGSCAPAHQVVVSVGKKK